MADSSDKSPNNKENTEEGSSIVKSPNKIKTTNESGGSSSLVAVPSSPSKPQDSGSGVARADGGSPKNGGSETKEGDECTEKPVKIPVKEGEKGNPGEKKSPSQPQVSGTGATRAVGESPKHSGSGTKEGAKGVKTPIKGGDQGSSGKKESPSKPQASDTGATTAVGESPKSGGSGTKEGDKAMKTPPKGGDQGSSGEKKRPRGRPRKYGSDPGLEKKPRRVKAKFDAPEIPAPCGVCGKKFNNYKALFGHLRVHPGRDWKGAFPPPVSRHTAVEQTPRTGVDVAIEISSTLLTIGRRILGESQGESSAAVANNRRGLEVDLNMPKEIVHFPTPPESGESEDDAAPIQSGDEKK